MFKRILIPLDGSALAEIREGKQVLEVLVQRFAYYAAASEHGAQATVDRFTEVSRAVDKKLWFSEAHLQG